MGGIYSYLIEAGFNPAYLDDCTFLDIDLFMRQTNERRKKSGWKEV